MSEIKATSLVRREEQEPKANEKGGSYIKLLGPVKDQFKALAQELGFDAENPRADKAVKKVGTMVAAMGIELAFACLRNGVENLAEYTAKIKAEALEEATAPAEDEPSDVVEATSKE